MIAGGSLCKNTWKQSYRDIHISQGRRQDLGKEDALPSNVVYIYVR